MNNSHSFAVFGVQFSSYKEIADLLNLSVDTPEKEEGCMCGFDRETCKFCPYCGCLAYVKFDDYDEQMAELIGLTLKKEGLGIEDFVDYGIYVGVWPIETGKYAIAKLLEANDKLVELFGKEGRFYQGAID